MSTVAAQHGSVASANPLKPRGSPWLVGPWFDCLFLANLAWPLLVLMQFADVLGGQSGLHFWQLYYVTTPHRWITLALVFLDRGRFRQRPLAFAAIAAAAIVFCLGVRMTTGALTCLLAIDYLWNAWHFAAQHHGIVGIYRRETGAAQTAFLPLEKWVMRLFLLYVILRVAAATWSDPSWLSALHSLDYVALIAPAWLIWRNLHGSAGQLIYLLSVCGLYLALLWAVHERQLALVLPLATASALFHAIEYLAIVSWSVQKRHAAQGQSMGLLAWLVPRWGLTLALFILILGAGGWLMDQNYLELWLTINVIVAFLHYAYDGLIWRRRAA